MGVNLPRFLALHQFVSSAAEEALHASIAYPLRPEMHPSRIHCAAIDKDQLSTSIPIYLRSC